MAEGEEEGKGRAFERSGLTLAWHPLKPCVCSFPCTGTSEGCSRGALLLPGSPGSYVRVGELRSGAWNAARNNWDSICELCYNKEMQRREGLEALADDADEAP